jgi:flagellar basal-body rod modification protein FlgD
MAVSNVSSTGTSNAAQRKLPSATLGKDDFLQLLVTKMQNQDPLNPTSDEDFVAQLAQFSSLEQMNNIAEGISTSNQWDYLQMQSLNNVMASGLIGKDIKANYSGTQISNGEPAHMAVSLDRFASQVTFVMTDASGNAVATMTSKNLQSGANTVTWDAKDNRGNRVPDGFYSITAKAYDVNGNEFTPSLNLVGNVESVIYREGAAYLRVRGLEIPLGDIAAVGEPGSFGGDGN